MFLSLSKSDCELYDPEACDQKSVKAHHCSLIQYFLCLSEIQAYLEQFQPSPNGLLSGNTFIVVICCSFYGLVHLFNKCAVKEKSWIYSQIQKCGKAQIRDKIHVSDLYLMDSVSIWTGAILSSKNFTISRNGLLGCLGLPSFFVTSFCKTKMITRPLNPGVNVITEQINAGITKEIRILANYTT